MRIFGVVSIVLSSLFLSACSEVGEVKKLFEKTPPVTCSSPEANTSIVEMVTEETQKAMQAIATSGEYRNMTEANIQTTLSRLNVNIVDVRTTEQATQSTKISCEAQINIQTPAEIWQRAQQMHELLHHDETLTQTLAHHGLTKKSDMLTKTIAYSVQPTDDKQKIYTKLENGTAIADGLALVLSSHLMKTDFDQEMAEAEAQYQAVEKEIQAQMQNRLLDAQEASKLAKQELNTLWSTLPKSTQEKLTDNQSAWVSRRDSHCAYEAANQSGDALEQQILQTLCANLQTHERIRELEQHAQNATHQMAQEAQSDLNALKSRMHQTWNGLPSEVKTTLEEEQLAWQNTTRNQCAQASNALAQVQCQAQAYTQRLDTLAGYSIH